VILALTISAHQLNFYHLDFGKVSQKPNLAKPMKKRLAYLPGACVSSDGSSKKNCLPDDEAAFLFSNAYMILIPLLLI